MVLLGLVNGSPSSGDELYAVDYSVGLIHDLVAFPSALGCLITGALLCWLTSWGFFKHNWIIVKWAVSTGVFVFSTFWLGSWIREMAAISGSEGLAALHDPTYSACRRMSGIFGRLLHLVLIGLVFISVLKPWKREKQLSAAV